MMPGVTLTVMTVMRVMKKKFEDTSYIIRPIYMYYSIEPIINYFAI